MVNRLISHRTCRDIIIDLDDVIADAAPEFKITFDRFTGTNIPVSSWTTYNFIDQYPTLDIDTIVMLMVGDKILERCKPINKAIESVQALKQYGYNIHIVTSRGLHPNAFNVSKQWLDMYNVPYDTLSVTNYGSLKSTSYNKISTCFAYMFDDNIANIADAGRNNVITPILISQPWSKHYPCNKVESLYHFCVNHGLLT